MARIRILGPVFAAAWLAARGGASLLVGGQPQAVAEPEASACLSCHGAIEAALKKKVKHAAMELGCVSCHLDHRQAPAGGERIPRYLTARQPELCLTCHEAGDKQLGVAHRGQPFGKAVCTGCHDAHSSDGPKLLESQQHGPFASRQCDGCHRAPEDGKVRLAAASASELCFRCHDEFKARVEKAKARHSLLTMSPDSCVDCHDPHASRQPHFLKKAVSALCNDCHAEMTEGRKFVHEPARASCVICHEGHASDFPSLLKVEVNSVCLGCHLFNANAPKNAAGEMVLYGDTAVPPEYVNRSRKVLLDAQGKGHPYIGHPTAAVADPSRKEKAMSCTSCHDPHAGNLVEMFVKDLRGQALCDACHK